MAQNGTLEKALGPGLLAAPCHYGRSGVERLPCVVTGVVLYVVMIGPTIEDGPLAVEGSSRGTGLT